MTIVTKKTRKKEGTMIRCPMKFSNPYPPDECQCEQDECRWWVDRFQMCAIALEACTDGLKTEGVMEGVIEQMAVASKRTL
jgi:hypothetical protein